MMTEEDEDIIFDQAALLPGDRSDDDVVPLTPNGSRGQGRVFITVCLCLAFFALVSVTVASGNHSGFRNFQLSLINTFILHFVRQMYCFIHKHCPVNARYAQN